MPNDIYYINDKPTTSPDTISKMEANTELYELIKGGLNDIAVGNTRPFSDAMKTIRNTRK